MWGNTSTCILDQILRSDEPESYTSQNAVTHLVTFLTWEMFVWRCDTYSATFRHVPHKLTQDLISCHVCIFSTKCLGSRRVCRVLFALKILKVFNVFATRVADENPLLVRPVRSSFSTNLVQASEVEQNANSEAFGWAKVSASQILCPSC